MECQKWSWCVQNIRAQNRKTLSKQQMAAVNPLVQVAAVAAASRAVGFVAANDSDAPGPGPAISNKAYCETFFEINNVTNEHACKYEDCKLHKGGRKISANIKHGYTNLMSHLKLTHPDYVND